MKKKFDADTSGPKTMSFSVSLPSDSYERLCYVADYFDWKVNKVASNLLMRALSDVKFGEDLDRAVWSDPRRLKK